MCIHYRHNILVKYQICLIHLGRLHTFFIQLDGDQDFKIYRTLIQTYLVSSVHVVTNHMSMISNYTWSAIRYSIVSKTQTISSSNFENNRMGNTSGHLIQVMSKYWTLSPWLLDTHLYLFWKLFFDGEKGMLIELS